MDVDAKETVNMTLGRSGGRVFAVDDLTRLRRFLCLGVEGGSCYATEAELAVENASALKRLLDAGKGEAVVAELVSWSAEGRAAKPNTLLFALAVCARQGDAGTKRAAYARLNAVCRTPTQLFAFLGFCEKLSAGSGWGRAHRRAVAAWYNTAQPSAQQLALHVTKFQQREGWTHQDVLRLCHVVPADAGRALVVKYAAKGWAAVRDLPGEARAAPGVAATWAFLEAVQAAKSLRDEEGLAALVLAHRLVREHVPTGMLNSLPVWKALLADMPLTALMRSLGKLSALGLLADDAPEHAAELAGVCARLRDPAQLRRARVHPLQLLVALRTYGGQRGHRGSLTWRASRAVLQALDDAFYAAFALVEPTGARFLLGLDVSGSMDSPLGDTPLSCREAASALVMATVRAEEHVKVMAFAQRLVPLPLARDASLEDVLGLTSDLDFGATDCSLPMVYALRRRLPVDVFVVYTDCETNCNSIDPHVALRQYREAMGIPARLIVMAMTSDGFSIADPEDAGMLDLAGFDANAPSIIRSFVLGEL